MHKQAAAIDRFVISANKQDKYHKYVDFRDACRIYLTGRDNKPREVHSLGFTLEQA
jgi:hypothetical protein